MQDHMIVIKPDGSVTAIYSDDFRLNMLGDEHVERASSVEFNNALQGWIVTLADGRVLCARPRGSGRLTKEIRSCCVFKTRDEALTREVEYIREHVL